MYTLDDFDYRLPHELIAQHPVRRGEERLMVIDREQRTFAHSRFENIINLLRPGDCLVFNDTRVIPARLRGFRPTGGAVELLLVHDRYDGRWECMSKTSKPLRTGSEILFSKGLQAIVEDRLESTVVVQFNKPDMVFDVGEVPLPPYISRPVEDSDRQNYQTVYARANGSVAAPTAGLHFTDVLIEKLKTADIDCQYLTLHVGPGTFQPVRTQVISEHRMHAEDFHVTIDAAQAIETARKDGRRIIAVGTTCARVLEHLMRASHSICPGHGVTDIFITPGHQFSVISGLITNFHLPCSTLIMLVSAFGGHDTIMSAYAEAVKEKYRFFSYGDVMLII